MLIAVYNKVELHQEHKLLNKKLQKSTKFNLTKLLSETNDFSDRKLYYRRTERKQTNAGPSQFQQIKLSTI